MATPAGPLVMVVDDDPEVCAFICETLKGEGYRTRALESGEAALELAPTERPALILLDVYLPDLDGYTVARRLRALPATAQTPIIFVTGADAPAHRMFSRELVHLQKPFTAAQLLRAVGQVLRRSEEPR